MVDLTSKWSITAMVLISTLLILFFMGRKSVHTELVIEASPQQIWAVLMNEERYEEWNQILIPIAGEIEQGNTLTYKLVRPDGEPLEIGMKVAALIPFKLLNQSGGIPGVLTYNHRYILEPVENKTKVTIHEEFKGIVIPFWNVNWIQQGYSDLTKSLRKHVLELHHD